jgi:hypothetical protein
MQKPYHGYTIYFRLFGRPNKLIGSGLAFCRIRLPFHLSTKKTTLKVMKDPEEGRNLTECEDAEDMFRKLETVI